MQRGKNKGIGIHQIKSNTRLLHFIHKFNLKSSMFKFLSNKAWKHLKNSTQTNHNDYPFRVEIIYCIRKSQ